MNKIDLLKNDSEFKEHIKFIKQLANLKNRDILRESVSEIKRQGNWVCIYPAKGAEVYDKYFA
jgi:hypothetical protein